MSRTYDDRTDRLTRRPDVVVGDPDDLVHLDWSTEWRPCVDTQVAVWLFDGDVERLGPAVTAALGDGADLVISPIVELELTYLYEIGRLRVTAAQIVADLRQRIGLTHSDIALTSAVAAAAPLSWARDPFDRLIVGDAVATICC